MNKLIYFVLAISVAAIIFAYFVEYILRIKPCALCIYQRGPYYVAILVSVGGLFIRNARYMKYLLLTYLVVFLLGGALSAYHIGVERGIIQQPISCSTSSSSTELSIDDVKKLIYGNSEVSCKEVNFKLLGLSMAEMNFALSAIMMIFIVWLFKKIKNVL